MLRVGDQVVYPMHGAGEIAGVEECEIMGQVRQYFILQLPVGDVRIMIPTDNADGIGLRQISPPETLEKVSEVLQQEPERPLGSWNKRFHNNLNRLKTGDILEVAAVIRNLILQDKRKRISGGEKRLLELARQIFVSEISFALRLSTEAAEAWMMGKLDGNRRSHS